MWYRPGGADASMLVVMYVELPPLSVVFQFFKLCLSCGAACARQVQHSALHDRVAHSPPGLLCVWTLDVWRQDRGAVSARECCQICGLQPCALSAPVSTLSQYTERAHPVLCLYLSWLCLFPCVCQCLACICHHLSSTVFNAASLAVSPSHSLPLFPFLLPSVFVTASLPPANAMRVPPVRTRLLFMSARVAYVHQRLG